MNSLAIVITLPFFKTNLLSNIKSYLRSDKTIIKKSYREGRFILLALGLFSSMNAPHPSHQGYVLILKNYTYRGIFFFFNLRKIKSTWVLTAWVLIWQYLISSSSLMHLCKSSVISCWVYSSSQTSGLVFIESEVDFKPLASIVISETMFLLYLAKNISTVLIILSSLNTF